MARDPTLALAADDVRIEGAHRCGAYPDRTSVLFVMTGGAPGLHAYRPVFG